MRNRLLLATAFCLFAVPAWPDSGVRAFAAAHRAQIMTEYLRLLALPNIHGDAPALSRNADLLLAMLKTHGLDGERWETSGGVPVLFGEKRVPGAKRTVLFYLHYDGQPVDPKRWSQPDPFTPVIRSAAIAAGGKPIDPAAVTDESRIYARSAADDKGPIESLLWALDALHGAPGVNVKVILHGEEEGAGPGLKDVIDKYPDRLKSDLLVIVDGPQHPSGRPTVFFGGRGGAGLTVTVFTARQGLHSGNYGNWMPDANVRLAQLIASMVDATGKVVIPGFYADVPPFDAGTRAMMAAVPDDTTAMRREFGVGATDGAAASLQEGLNLPTFSVHRMQGGEVAGVIPASATAEIAMRLVRENDPRAMVGRVTDFIRAQGYFITGTDPDAALLAAHPRVARIVSRVAAGGSGAWRTDADNPQALAATAALKAAWGDRVVRIRTLGGGVPAAPFIEAFHVPLIGVSLANYDDNQHSDNENMRFGNLLDGVVTLAALMQG